MGNEISRKKFIRVGAVLGAGTASAALISACGGSSGAQAGSGKKNDPGNNKGGAGVKGSGSGKSGKVITQESKVAPNSAVQFTDSGQPAILIHLKDGSFVAYSAVCTHMGCTVGYDKNNGMLVCPCHGSTYDPAHGAKVVQGPAPKPLPAIQIKTKGGKIIEA